MKIKNITNNKELKIPMKKNNGVKVIVILAPGEVVYSEVKGVNLENKQILIYKRKNLIEVTDDDVPKNGEYYKSYKVIHSNANPVSVIVESEEDEDSASGEDVIPGVKLDDDEIDLEGENEDDDISNEGKESKKKGRKKKNTELNNKHIGKKEDEDFF